MIVHLLYVHKCTYVHVLHHIWLKVITTHISNVVRFFFNNYISFLVAWAIIMPGLVIEIQSVRMWQDNVTMKLYRKTKELWLVIEIQSCLQWHFLSNLLYRALPASAPKLLSPCTRWTEYFPDLGVPPGSLWTEVGVSPGTLIPTWVCGWYQQGSSFCYTV